MARKTGTTSKATTASSKAAKPAATRGKTKAAAKTVKAATATCKAVAAPATKCSTPAAKPVAKPAAKKEKKRRITFSLQTEPGQQIFVAGNFNDWDPTAKEMVDKQGKGLYKAVLCLTPGEYQYKFVINGTWCVDQANQSWIQNSHGTLNSVIHVE